MGPFTEKTRVWRQQLSAPGPTLSLGCLVLVDHLTVWTLSFFVCKVGLMMSFPFLIWELENPRG